MPASPRDQDKRLLKGRRTRERLLEEALHLFAEKGYAGVGVREVAAAARTNVASIAFHFSGKEGLYEAVVEDVAGELARLHQAVFAEAHEASEAAGEDDRLRVARIVRTLTARLLLSNRSRWMSLLLQREFITPTPFFPKLYATALRPTLETFCALLRRLRGDGASALDRKTVAFALFILSSAFVRNKNTFLHFTGKDGYAPEDVETIARVMADFVLNGLGEAIL